MRVFLIHGMGRTSVSLALLAARLRKASHCSVDAIHTLIMNGAAVTGLVQRSLADEHVRRWPAKIQAAGTPRQ
jgi:hypothetical protein